MFHSIDNNFNIKNDKHLNARGGGGGVHAPKDIEVGTSKYCLPANMDEINSDSENVAEFLNEEYLTSDDGGDNDDHDTLLRNIKLKMLIVLSLVN